MPMLATSRMVGAVLCAGLLCVGCAHPTYSPYGYGYGQYGPAYPSYGPSGPAPQYLGPGTGPTYVPQSVPSSGSPTPLTNPPSNGTLNMRPGPASPSDTDAPSFNPNPNSGSRPVPPGRDPLDDLNNANPGAGASLPIRGSTTAQLPTFERGGLAAAAPPVVADIVQTSGNEPDPFETPMPSRLPTELDANPMNAPPPETTPYQYDGQTYKWLKGAIDYDPLTKTWSIIYNMTPDLSDKYGGSFILSGHPDLASFQGGEIVIVEGGVDPRAKDSTGRPIYSVTKVTGPLIAPTR